MWGFIIPAVGCDLLLSIQPNRLASASAPALDARYSDRRCRLPGLVIIVSFFYRAFRAIAALALRRRGDEFEREIELLVLGRQVNVLSRSRERPRYNDADRTFLALLSRLLTRQRWIGFLVTPGSVVPWHRNLVRYRHRRRSRPIGRPKTGRSTREMVIMLAEENHAWGYRPVCGELKKIGVYVSASLTLASPGTAS